MIFSRILQGVEQVCVIDGATVRSVEGRRSADNSALQRYFIHYPTLHTNDEQFRIAGPISLVDKVMELGRKGIGITL